MAEHNITMNMQYNVIRTIFNDLNIYLHSYSNNVRGEGGGGLEAGVGLSSSAPR